MIFQILTGLVALAIGLYAYRGYRLIQDRTLGALFLAFVLLAIGFLVKGLVLGVTWSDGINPSDHSTLVSILNLGFWTYYVLSIIAFGILIYTYSRKLAGQPASFAAAVAGPTLLLINPSLELIIVILLLIIVIAQLTHLMIKKTLNGETVLVSFILILLSHISFMLSSVREEFFIVASIIQLIAFSLLLLVLYRLRGPQ